MAVAECDIPLAGAIESTIRQGVIDAMVADADFATDQATTLANIATRNAKILAGQNPDKIARYYSLVEAVKRGFALLGSTTMIADTATIYAACPGGNWQPGFSLAL